MKLEILLEQLFPGGCAVSGEQVFAGTGSTASGEVAVIGTRRTMIGVREIIMLSERFLDAMRDPRRLPILLLVDHDGQKMALEDELLGLNQYIAHLTKLQDWARRQGQKVIALVYGNSIAGGFIAFGLCAGRTYALPDANTSVMRLEAISRVTKLPLEQLAELSKTVAVFAPGVNNFIRTGGLHGIWEGDLNTCLELALAEDESADIRGRLGQERGGCPKFAEIVEKVVHA